MTAAKPAASTASGAAFLMAVSAIGPGFLTQTTQFTAQLGASLAFAILLSTLIDVGAQLNTWRVLCVTGRRGQEVAEALWPGLGWLLTGIIVIGSFIFNLGNLNGCALGLQTLLNLSPLVGAAVSAALAVALSLLPRMLTAVDWVSKGLGAAMILTTFFVLVRTVPPLREAARQALAPASVDIGILVTLVGGTVGGYVMFSGAHRLLEGGIVGPEQLQPITWAAVQGILVAGVMRTVLFLAVLGVIQSGVQLSPQTPVFDAFRAGAGEMGYLLSGFIFWSAAITSVIGCSYTSVTFLGTGMKPRRQAGLIAGFIVVSWLVTLACQLAGWEATPLLIFAGKANGVLLPFILGIVLWAARSGSLMGDQRQPLWAALLGWFAWMTTAFFAGWIVYHALA